jgi:hypothetical protein
MEDPILNNDELAKQIKDGEYTVPQKPGALSPAQFNMAQGMTASQADGIEVLITNDAGETEALGLVEYTLMMSEGTAIEDAIQEGTISINFTKSDNELWSTVSRITFADDAEYRTFSFATYSSLVPVYGVFLPESKDRPDGVLKRFKTASPQLGKSMEVYLNGNFQATVQLGVYEFIDAPATNDVVEFVGEARDCNAEILRMEDSIKSIEAEKLKTTEDKDSTLIEINEEISKSESELVTAKEEVAAAFEGEAEAKKVADEKTREMLEAKTVDNVNKLRDEAILSYGSAKLFSISGGKAELEVKNIEVDIAASNVDKSSLTNAFASYESGAESAIAELKANKQKLEDDIKKWNDFGNEAG